MKLFIIFFLALIAFSSCSSDDDSSKEMKQMEMDENVLFKGDFVSVAHPTSGAVSINKDKTVLSIANFKSDSGPLLELYLATDTSAKTYITLGVLKGLDGNYTYNLPKDVDYTVYKYVTVWCVDFDVDFGHAVLVGN